MNSPQSDLLYWYSVVRLTDSNKRFLKLIKTKVIFALGLIQSRSSGPWPSATTTLSGNTLRLDRTVPPLAPKAPKQLSCKSPLRRKRLSADEISIPTAVSSHWLSAAADMIYWTAGQKLTKSCRGSTHSERLWISVLPFWPRPSIFLPFPVPRLCSESIKRDCVIYYPQSIAFTSWMKFLQWGTFTWMETS